MFTQLYSCKQVKSVVNTYSLVVNKYDGPARAEKPVIRGFKDKDQILNLEKVMVMRLHCERNVVKSIKKRLIIN